MNNLGINWLDVITITLVVVGVWVGRRRGASSELLDLIQWVLIIVVGARLSDPLGRFLVLELTLDPVTSYILAYLSVAVAIWFPFFLFRRFRGEKIVSSDFFGGFEYYLGMVAGPVRFLCILIFALALLHAKPPNEQALASKIEAQKESLGAIYFPPFGIIQHSIFEHSLTGRIVTDHLADLLVTADPKAATGAAREGLGRRREREVYEITR